MPIYLDRNRKLGPLVPLEKAVEDLLEFLPANATNVAVVVFGDSLQDVTGSNEIEVNGKTYQVRLESPFGLNFAGEASLIYAVEV